MDYEIPRHRIVNDYMALVKSSQIYRNLESYSLNYIAELLLGLKKVSYTGNLRSLYKDNFPRFVGYSLVDTILVMLIHKVTNLYNGDFSSHTTQKYRTRKFRRMLFPKHSCLTNFDRITLCCANQNLTTIPNASIKVGMLNRPRKSLPGLCPVSTTMHCTLTLSLRLV